MPDRSLWFHRAKMFQKLIYRLPITPDRVLWCFYDGDGKLLKKIETTNQDDSLPIAKGLCEIPPIDVTKSFYEQALKWSLDAKN